MRRVAFVVLLAALATTASAQDSVTRLPPLNAGARVRVAVEKAGAITGRVVAVTGDTLHVLPDDARDTMHLAISRLTALDVSTGQHPRRWAGAAIGLVVGAAAGAAIASATYHKQDCPPSALFCDYGGREMDTMAGAVLLGGVGALVGAIAAAGNADSWRSVLGDEHAQLRIVVPSGQGRVGLTALLTM